MCAGVEGSILDGITLVQAQAPAQASDRNRNFLRLIEIELELGYLSVSMPSKRIHPGALRVYAFGVRGSRAQALSGQ